MQQQQRLAGNDPNAPPGMIPNMLPQQQQQLQSPANESQPLSDFPLQQQQQQQQQQQPPPHPPPSLTNFQPSAVTGVNNMDYDDSSNTNEAMKDT